MPLRVLNTILSSWFSLNILWLLLSFMPHARVHFFSWINHSLYTLLFLLTLFIVKRDPFKKPVFISLGLYFLAHIASVITIFVGKYYSFGTNLQTILYWIYMQIPVRAFGCLAVLYLTAHYLVPRRWVKTSYVILGLGVLLLTWLLFKPFLPATAIIRQPGWQAAFSWRLVLFSVVPAAALLCYGIVNYVTNRPDGRYMSLLAFMLFIIHFYNCVDFIAETHRAVIYGIDQYFLLACLLGTIPALFLRLAAVESEQGRCYERLLFDQSYLTQISVVFHDHTLLQWWPLVRNAIDRSLLIHLAVGAVYLILALESGSLYNTVKLTLLVIWIGVLIILINRKYKKSQAGVMLHSVQS